MKFKFTFPTLTAICLASVLSCTKPCTTCNDQLTTSTLKISLGGEGTKTTVSTSIAEDNTINTLDILIFRNTDPSSPDYQKLDTYRHFEQTDPDNIVISTTTGPKTICVIANDHSNTFDGVSDLRSFRELVTNLKDEQLRSFTMYGETDALLDITSEVSVSLKRHISKICVSSIKTLFDGTPYAGKELTDAKLYLLNVHGEKTIANNASSPATPLVLNEKKVDGNDVNSLSEAYMIYESLGENIDDTGTETPHYLYCYSNQTSDLERCTKVVLEGKLDGVTYYYPIPVNQENYGYLPTNNHYGVAQNTFYSYGITITRPGSLDPNIPIVPGTLEILIDVMDWVNIPHFNKIF